MQIREPVDIFLSHDWPRGIEQYGNVAELVRLKPFFQKEVRVELAVIHLLRAGFA